MSAPPSLRVLIVDDERLAREKLRRFLAEWETVRVVGEAENGSQAVARIREQRPDVVFLDIQMPGMDGFGVLSQLSGRGLPAFVFVSAHDEYAIRAFEVEAIDYLLKPFDRARLGQALERARRQVDRGPEELARKLERVLAAQGGLRRIAIRADDRIQSVRVDDIQWFEAADNYVKVHIGKAVHLIRETLANLERRLPAAAFVRVHRSAIVSLDAVREVESLFHGDYEVVLRTGERIAVGRKYRESLLKALGERR
jgi:two-component system LytT family response regulator